MNLGNTYLAGIYWILVQFNGKLTTPSTSGITHSCNIKLIYTNHSTLKISGQLQEQHTYFQIMYTIRQKNNLSWKYPTISSPKHRFSDEVFVKRCPYNKLQFIPAAFLCNLAAFSIEYGSGGFPTRLDRHPCALLSPPNRLDQVLCSWAKVGISAVIQGSNMEKISWFYPRNQVRTKFHIRGKLTQLAKSKRQYCNKERK